MTGLRRCFLLAAVVAAVAATASSAAAGTITVHGTGIVETTPTTADFTFGVSALGSTATAALSANARKMNQVIDAVKGRGVAAADIQTAQISLQPNENSSGDKILNYTVTNSVTVHVRSIANAGPVVDAAVHAGSNEIDGPSLAASDQLILSRQALKAAMADARARAQAIASAAGVKLGAVRSVSDQTASTTPLPFANAAASPASTPVSAGTVSIESDVTVTYAIA
jgi:uncharacterized protein YggE